MSNARYLEVDSTYRNRKEWPQAAEFVVPISQTGRKGPKQAVDPVSEAAAEVLWVGNSFDAVLNGDLTSGPGPAASDLKVAEIIPPPLSPGVGGASGTGQLALILTCKSGHAQIANNYYRHAILQTGTGANIQRSRIASSIYLGLGTDPTTPTTILDRIQVRLWSSISVVPGDGVEIQDPTDLSTTTDPLLFVPSGKLAPNAYTATFIYNISLAPHESRRVAGYNAATHLLRPDTSGVTSSTTGPTVGWLSSHTYAIRPDNTGWCGNLDPLGYPLPFINTSRSFNFPITATTPAQDLVGSFLEVEYTQISGTAAVLSNATQVVLSTPAIPVDDYYNGCLIRIVDNGGPVTIPCGERRIINGYNSSTNTVTVSPPFTSTTVGYNYHITCGGTQEPDSPTACVQESRRIVKYVDYSATAVSTTSTTIVFPLDASNVEEYYTGLFIRVDPAGINDLRLITNYVVTRDGSGVVISRVATVDIPFGPIPPTPDFTITSGLVNGPFTFSLYDQKVCILPFSYDNLSPFVYNGSQVSQQDTVCYEIELLNLVLPNQILAVGEGGFVSYYPYVYVQLMNVDASGGHLKNTIYSNNPNATNMIFRAAIDDVPNPLTSTFIKIDGDGAVQTIKFKPNDNLLFSVHMPDGDVFQTIEPEWFSPCMPNPKAQISAYFSMKRV